MSGQGNHYTSINGLYKVMGVIDMTEVVKKGVGETGAGQDKIGQWIRVDRPWSHKVREADRLGAIS